MNLLSEAGIAELGALAENSDVVVSMGLIEYFSDETVLLLLTELARNMRPGTRLLLGNYQPDHPSRAVMEWYLDWWLVAHYFVWQGKAREALMAEFYPEFADDLRRGFGLITEFAHMDFHHECRLFDQVIVRLTIPGLSRTRIEFAFEYVREQDGLVLAHGRQAVIWVNPQQRPSLMPDKLYNLCRDNFDFAGKPSA